MTTVIIKEPESKPIAKMIIPGRRALGEQWQEVTIGVKDDVIQVTENKPAEAPPNATPIFTFGMTQLSPDAMNFILEGAIQQQEYARRKPKKPKVTDAEIEEMVNRMWIDFCEQKLKWFKGQTTLGAGGFFQRETPGRTNWTGVKA